LQFRVANLEFETFLKISIVAGSRCDVCGVCRPKIDESSGEPKGFQPKTKEIK